MTRVALLALAWLACLLFFVSWRYFKAGSPKVFRLKCCFWPTDQLIRQGSSSETIHSSFERYDAANTGVSAWIVSTLGRVGPERGDTIHRFFDSSPFSPSGRFIAATRLPPPQYSLDLTHHLASVVVIDLERGKEQEVALTQAWGAQVGAHAQWGGTDDELFFNQVRKGGAIEGVLYGVESRKVIRVLPCPVYHATLDGKFTATPNLRKIRHTQFGYGVDYADAVDTSLSSRYDSSANRNAPKTDGLFVNDVDAGTCRLLVSLHDFATVAGLDVHHTPTYGFHVKWSYDGERLLFVMRSLERARGVHGMLSGHRVRRQHLFVLRADGSGIRHLLSWSSKEFDGDNDVDEEEEGGMDCNHPNWIPGSYNVSINMKPRSHVEATPWSLKVFDTNTVLFEKEPTQNGMLPQQQQHVKDTLMLREVFSPGSGHPNFAVGGRFVILDVYAKERHTFGSYQHAANASNFGSRVGSGERYAPLRLVDIDLRREVWLLQAQLVPDAENEARHALVHPRAPNKEKRAWRCDMHPSFSRSGNWVAFNARPHGAGRELLIAHVPSLPKYFANERR